ncbi:hypothetical protein CASFOL_014650 [Castilleja foliolosa]|uniref:Uncharacterized protein n=1 Tax=Castilleja foliolosa TaxID=1961234 RepID=A0ABD3DDA6_9LAMI
MSTRSMCIRMTELADCEKLKKVLNVNRTEAPLNIECLMDKAVGKGLEKALDEAELTLENIHSVEVVGARSHAPAVFKILADFF